MTTIPLHACGLLFAFLGIFSMNAVANVQDNRPPSARGTETASQLATINADLAEMKKTQAEIMKMLQDAAPTLLQIEKTVLQTQKNTSDLAALKDRLERLEERVNRAQAAIENRRAGANPTPNLPMGTAGQIQITNLLWTPVTVVVDGYTYFLRPNETRFVNRQAGNFTYEVVGIQANVLRSLAVGETFTIRINP